MATTRWPRRRQPWPPRYRRRTLPSGGRSARWRWWTDSASIIRPWSCSTSTPAWGRGPGPPRTAVRSSTSPTGRRYWGHDRRPDGVCGRRDAGGDRLVQDAVQRREARRADPGACAMTTRTHVHVALFIALFITSAAFGQQHPNLERGFTPEKMYDFSAVDSVNMFNGNMTLHIPIGGELRAKGVLPYQLTLVYNSLFWEYVNLPPLRGGA